MKKYFIVLVSLVLLASCTSKSKKRELAPVEKVVIIEVKARTIEDVKNQRLYQYKVKRIEKGVTDYTYDINRYEVGDTILKRFQ